METKITEDTIRTYVQKFIDIIDYAIEFDITIEEGVYHVQMQGENLGALIGFHGKNIASIEVILNLMINREEGFGNRIFIDINDYRKNRFETIKKLVDNAISRLEKNKEAIDLSPMPAYERLWVHNYITKYPHVEGASQGVEPNRYISLCYKEN